MYFLGLLIKKKYTKDKGIIAPKIKTTRKKQRDNCAKNKKYWLKSLYSFAFLEKKYLSKWSIISSIMIINIDYHMRIILILNDYYSHAIMIITRELFSYNNDSHTIIILIRESFLYDNYSHARIIFIRELLPRNNHSQKIYFTVINVRAHACTYAQVCVWLDFFQISCVGFFGRVTWFFLANIFRYKRD